VRVVTARSAAPPRPARPVTPRPAPPGPARCASPAATAQWKRRAAAAAGAEAARQQAAAAAPAESVRRRRVAAGRRHRARSRAYGGATAWTASAAPNRHAQPEGRDVRFHRAPPVALHTRADAAGSEPRRVDDLLKTHQKKSATATPASPMVRAGCGQARRTEEIANGRGLLSPRQARPGEKIARRKQPLPPPRGHRPPSSEEGRAGPAGSHAWRSRWSPLP
jgi:hypothetical protein